jgi:phospholipid/cholesterol/gamma-HCH transport system substrate-binding protein
MRRELTPLVRQATPLLRELRPSLRDLNSATPNLIRTARVLNYLANELGHNPPGPEEGYLFWTAWFAHNADSIFSIEDAHGAVWRGLVMGSCSSLQGFYSLVLPPAISAPLLSLPTCP